jgi:hypothetical protein
MAEKVHRDMMDLYDDPVPDPYPEMDNEVFDMYHHRGLTPADIHDEKEAAAYQKWLDKQDAKGG